MSERKYTVEEVAKMVGVEGGIITEYVRKEWLTPQNPDQFEFDDEDLARAQLISDLIQNLGVNDEAVPIILHLVDQIHFLKLQIKRGSRATLH